MNSRMGREQNSSPLSFNGSFRSDLSRTALDMCLCLSVCLCLCYNYVCCYWCLLSLGDVQPELSEEQLAASSG